MRRNAERHQGHSSQEEDVHHVRGRRGPLCTTLSTTHTTGCGFGADTSELLARPGRGRWGAAHGALLRLREAAGGRPCSARDGHGPRLHARGQGTPTCSRGASKAFKSTCQSGRETPKTEKSDGRSPTLTAVLDGSGSVRTSRETALEPTPARMTERQGTLQGRSTRRPRRPGEGPAARL